MSKSGFLICKRHLHALSLSTCLRDKEMCSINLPSHPCFAWFPTQCTILYCHTIYAVGGITISILQVRKLRSRRKWCCWDSTPVLSDSESKPTSLLNCQCTQSCWKLQFVWVVNTPVSPCTGWGKLQVHSCM